MTNPLSTFLREQMKRRGMSNQQVADASKGALSKQLVSKWATNKAPKLTKLPHRETLDGFARALNVPVEWLQGKAIESLGLDYSTGDYVHTVDNASNDELLSVIRSRMTEPRRLRVVDERIYEDLASYTEGSESDPPSPD